MARVPGRLDPIVRRIPMIKGYAMLGIPKDATRKDTKKAWRCAPRCFIPEWGKSPITTG